MGIALRILCLALALKAQTRGSTQANLWQSHVCLCHLPIRLRWSVGDAMSAETAGHYAYEVVLVARPADPHGPGAWLEGLASSTR